MFRLFLRLAFIFSALTGVASAEDCGPGIPAGMTAAPKSIVVNICSPDRMFVEDEQYDSETILAGVNAAMDKKKKAPVMIFMPSDTEENLKNELLNIVFSAPKGSGFAMIKDDGTFAGWQS